MENKDKIKNLVFDNIKTDKFYKNEAFESIAISIEKGKTLKKHTSHLDACLLMLEGEIDFKIHDKIIRLSAMQNYSFKKNIEHEVEAIENAKFILIR